MKNRRPAAVAALIPATLGVYWFVWTYRAFAEFRRRFGLPKQNPWNHVPLVAMAVASAGVGVAVTFSQLRILSAGGSQDSGFTGAAGVALVFAAAFYAAQVRVLRDDLRLLDEQAKRLGCVRPPRVWHLALSFALIWAGGAIPLVGIALALPGTVIFFRWLVQVQRSLNSLATRAARRERRQMAWPTASVPA